MAIVVVTLVFVIGSLVVREGSVIFGVKIFKMCSFFICAHLTNIFDS